MVEEDTTNLLHLTCPYMYEVKGCFIKTDTYVKTKRYLDGRFLVY